MRVADSSWASAAAPQLAIAPDEMLVLPAELSAKVEKQIAAAAANPGVAAAQLSVSSKQELPPKPQKRIEESCRGRQCSRLHTEAASRLMSIREQWAPSQQSSSRRRYQDAMPATC